MPPVYAMPHGQTGAYKDVGGRNELQKVAVVACCFSSGHLLHSRVRCSRHPHGGSGCYAHDQPTNSNPHTHEYANGYTSGKAANGGPPAHEHANQ